MRDNNDSELDSGPNWKYWYILIVISNLVFITIIYRYFSQIS